MFQLLQVNLRNMLEIAESRMPFTREAMSTFKAIIELLSDRRWVAFGLGEDIESITGPAERVGDRLVVDELETLPAVITFPKLTYAYDLSLEQVMVSGERVSWTVTKVYEDESSTEFAPGDLPLLSGNFQLKVTIQPGGWYEGAALLQKIVMARSL